MRGEFYSQVQCIERVFGHTDLQVIGIHTVFEHHAAMSPVTLEAFLREYRIKHPVGVDLADNRSDTPITMKRFALQGTPSSILIGRDGSVMHQQFGVEDELAVGALIATALPLRIPSPASRSTVQDDGGCAAGRCEVPSGSAVGATLKPPS
ncbi:TlpA family protein disulfide reductase [Rhizobium sp. Leaf383]|uniref:TlpA family protein disulfide reductase n=1 Tax=Rhizobium sp. Leaf383 TaxID=1736357 RepID=UPI000B1D4650